MEESVEETTLAGFDPEGEPMVRRTATGRLYLCLQFVPPSWAADDQRTGSSDLGVWADLGRKLACAARVPVLWEDREWFRIDRPRKNTVTLVHKCLLRERQWRDPHAPQRPGPEGPPEPFSFNYRLEVGGYAAVELGVGGRVAAIDTFATRDSLAHLSDAVLQLTAGRSEDEVVFETDSSGEYLLDLRRAGAIVEVALWEFDSVPFPGDPNPAGKLVLEGWCLLRDLRERVTAVLERLLAEHGLAGYRDLSVEYDFPLDKLVQLRQVGAGGPDAEPGAAPDPAM